MKTGFYPKFALDGIRKNKRLYIPYILTCTGMVMMYYIILFLQHTDAISYMPGAGTIHSMLGFGGWVIAIFAAVFLFYTNSFLIRRRKKEFGLYNILGMDKWNIGRILFWEVLIVAVSSLGIGLIIGIALSKLAELGLVNLLKADVTYTLSISASSIAMTVTVFSVIYALLFLNTIRQVRISNAIALLHSENVGEKPPKANWFFGILGVIMLAAAYYIAIVTEDPVSALVWFFAAVILVIIGTYLVFIAGSVLLCRILQKHKSYYYKANHFVSVSSMIYRMKRNGAGLASICILAIMVLVMISSTTSLYFGSEDSLRNRFPKEINIELLMENVKDLKEANISSVRDSIIEISNNYGVKPENITDYRLASFSGLMNKDTVEIDASIINNIDTYSNVYQFFMVPLDDYNRIMNAHEMLEANEILIYTYRTDYMEDTLTINGGETFHVKKHLNEFIGNGNAAMNVISSMYIIVPDLSSYLEGITELSDNNGERMVSLRWTYEFDTQVASDRQIELNSRIRETLKGFAENNDYFIKSVNCNSRAANRDDYYNTFGSFFFLGIILSIVFIFAAVLIIYYKQISEGYEDQARFDIMQKVGMTKKEIRRSINSQLLTVFFLPLIFAGMHLAFAFPIIRKLLLLFNLNNVKLFAATTVISFLIFALFYTLVYRITSNAYYNIVSGAKEEIGLHS